MGKIGHPFTVSLTVKRPFFYDSPQGIAELLKTRVICKTLKEGCTIVKRILWESFPQSNSLVATIINDVDDEDKVDPPAHSRSPFLTRCDRDQGFLRGDTSLVEHLGTSSCEHTWETCRCDEMQKYAKLQKFEFNRRALSQCQYSVQSKTYLRKIILYVPR